MNGTLDNIMYNTEKQIEGKRFMYIVYNYLKKNNKQIINVFSIFLYWERLLLSCALT